MKYTIEVDAQTEIKRGFLAGQNGDQAYQVDGTVSAVGKTEKCSTPIDIYIKVSPSF